MRHVKQFLTIFLVVGVMFSFGLIAAVDNPRVIEGEPLRITVYDDSTMHVEFNRERCGGDQYNENSKGSILLVDKEGTNYVLGWGGGYNTFQLYGNLDQEQFTAVSNTLTTLGDTSTVVTVYNAGLTGDVQVTQTVTYTNGDIFYKIEWVVTNNGGETYTGLHFRHGGDTSFRGGEPSIGNWGPGLNMVYITKENSGDLMGLYGALGHYGETPSPASNFVERLPADVRNFMVYRNPLNNFYIDSNHDAAYGLEWLKDSLLPGESWTVTAFERIDDCEGDPRQGLVVTGENTGGVCGTTIPVTFYVENFRTVGDTYDLSVVSQNGWPVNIVSINPVTIGAADFAVVDVELTIPPLTLTPDVVTLTATSQSDNQITDSGDANIIVTCTQDRCLDVLTPTEQDTAVCDEPLSITWFTFEPGLVKITLWQEDEFGVEQNLGVIGDNIDTSLGEYIWVAENLPGLTNIRPVRIKVKIKGTTCSDWSDYFFTTCNDNPECSEGDKALIVAPNGGETFNIGDDMTIEWSALNVPPGNPERVRLSLWTYDVNTGYAKVGRIAENIDVRQEVIVWNILEVYDSTTNTMINVQPGSNYVIKIREKDRGCHDYSDAVFSILPPPNPNDLCPSGAKAELTFPNTGETFSIGQQITITWSNGPAPLGLTRLSLWGNVGGDFVQIGQIADDVPAADGSYSWIINQVWESETNTWIPVTPGTYLFKIREKGGPTPDYRRCHDYPDEWVTITDVEPL